jgi:hypothetical protein
MPIFAVKLNAKFAICLILGVACRVEGLYGHLERKTRAYFLLRRKSPIAYLF